MEKRRFSFKLRKRLAWRKNAEPFLRREVHNIRQDSHLSNLQPSLVEKIRY